MHDVAILGALLFGILGVFAAYESTWWLIAPQWVICGVCIVIATAT